MSHDEDHHRFFAATDQERQQESPTGSRAGSSSSSFNDLSTRGRASGQRKAAEEESPGEDGSDTMDRQQKSKRQISISGD